MNFWGIPRFFFLGGGRGAEGDQSSLTELRRTTIELTASEVGSLQYYRTLRGIRLILWWNKQNTPALPPHSPGGKMTGSFLSLLQLFRVLQLSQSWSFLSLEVFSPRNHLLHLAIIDLKNHSECGNKETYCKTCTWKKLFSSVSRMVLSCLNLMENNTVRYQRTKLDTINDS